MSNMTLEKAKALLSNSFRSELRDHFFGDREITWSDEHGEDVATGYAGGNTAEVHIGGSGEGLFVDAEARSLMGLGKVKEISRNDSAGPDEYKGA